MLEKPDFPDERIAAILRADYDIAAREIEFLPIGYDPASSVYRVQAESGATYFLKLRRGAVYEPALIVPHRLKDSGIEPVVAPLTTLGGALAVPADAYTLILYPYIDGENGMKRGLTERQWIEFGATLRRIHDKPLTPDLTRLVERETFSARGGRERLRRLLAHAESLSDGDSTALEMAALWREKRADLTRIVDRAEALAQQIQTRTLDFVLCHSDIHTANVLIGDDGRLHVVDWDQPLIAPKERDLMFVLGSAGVVGVGSEDQARFIAGYGETRVDPVAFAYYRYDWVVQDAGEFALSGFGFDGQGEETRRDAVRMMRGMFDPGGVFDAAYAADRIDFDA